MELTERQIRILNNIIKNYIRSVEPVSSEFLEKKYDFGVCSATIRNEMQKLTDEGFVSQPHTSAGRVPTDKGYRFFVDSLLQEHSLKDDVFESDWFDGETNDTIKFLQSVTKNLALVSSNLSLGYLSDKKILWKEGWEEIIKEPEFKERKLIDDFIAMVKNFEEEIADFEINSEIRVFIGKENPWPKAKEWALSFPCAGCGTPQNRSCPAALYPG
jgi:transcriptional regulator of heat shock response